MKKIVELIKRLFGAVETPAKQVKAVVVEAETKAEAEIHDIEKAVESLAAKVKAPRKPRTKKKAE